MKTNMNKSFFFKTLLLSVFVFGCKTKNKTEQVVTIKNTLSVPRTFETVELNKSDLVLKDGVSFTNLSVKDLTTNTIVVSQFVDNNQDGEMDTLLFQPEVGANSESRFELVVLDKKQNTEVIDYCYSRFVPERTDDYAWENDKVGFRTFGPVAQKMVEDGVKGGTLSSGIDAWLKKVDYPIINKWYEKATAGTGSYHEDTGEGLDNFHVGVSRGVGGIAVKQDTTFYVSRNFTNWKTITTGPIRTSFVLEYANWDANGKTITEKKHISLDYGNNLSKFEIEISGTETFYAGLTLHKNEGKPSENIKNGWISYWEPHFGSELGMAIVVPNNQLKSSELFVTPLKDQSNLFAEIKVANNKSVYYAGFAWEESKQFKNKQAWEAYLNTFSLKLNNPLLVSLK